MSEKMRESFEDWCRYNNIQPPSTLMNGQIPHNGIELAWKAWQASRAALVVELPANCKGMALTVDELRVILDEIGQYMSRTTEAAWWGWQEAMKESKDD